MEDLLGNSKGVPNELFVLKFPKWGPPPLEACPRRVLRDDLEKCSWCLRAEPGEEGGPGPPLHFVFGLGEMATKWEKARSSTLWPRESVSSVTGLCTWTWASMDE